MVDAGEVLVASGDDEVDDDARKRTVSSGAWSETTNSSRDEGERRLEAVRSTVTFGSRSIAFSAADTMERNSQGGAPEEKKREGSERETRGSPAATDLSGDVCRDCELRRRIATAWRHNRERGKGERGEGSEGFL
jgi:hypothetical protein